MSLPIIAIRPEPGLAATIALGRTLGLGVMPLPLFELRACDWAAPDPDGFDGLLLGSANAIRLGGPQLAALRQLPVHAVGAATAEAARAAGFTVATVGNGGLQAVVDRLGARPTRLLRLGGRDRTVLAAARTIAVTDRVVYENAALAAPPDLAQRLAAGAVVLLHSGRAARHFASECKRLAVARGLVRLAALAPAIAAAAGTGWADLRSAPQPEDRALLAMAENMCQ